MWTKKGWKRPEFEKKNYSQLRIAIDIYTKSYVLYIMYIYICMYNYRIFNMKTTAIFRHVHMNDNCRNLPLDNQLCLRSLPTQPKEGQSSQFVGSDYLHLALVPEPPHVVQLLLPSCGFWSHPLGKGDNVHMSRHCCIQLACGTKRMACTFQFHAVRNLQKAPAGNWQGQWQAWATLVKLEKVPQKDPIEHQNWSFVLERSQGPMVSALSDQRTHGLGTLMLASESSWNPLQTKESSLYRPTSWGSLGHSASSALLCACSWSLPGDTNGNGGNPSHCRSLLASRTMHKACKSQCHATSNPQKEKHGLPHQHSQCPSWKDWSLPGTFHPPPPPLASGPSSKPVGMR